MYNNLRVYIRFIIYPRNYHLKGILWKKTDLTYKKLKNLLEIGHEIEFVYDGVYCSINNLGDDNHESAWVFSKTFNDKSENIFLADFYDTENLLNNLDKIKIKEKSLEEVIDQALYDPSSLTIF